MGRCFRRCGCRKSYLTLSSPLTDIQQLFSLGQTVAVSFEALQILGKHAGELHPAQLTLFEKVHNLYRSPSSYATNVLLQAEYAGCMLYLANMGCSRISVCFLVKKILPGERATRFMWYLTIFSMLWVLSGIFVTAFPCSVPRPWDFFRGSGCINVKTWINYVGISNIIIEVIVVSVPLFVWNLRLSAGKKVSISLVFLSRL